jgi:hypothetical protein
LVVRFSTDKGSTFFFRPFQLPFSWIASSSYYTDYSMRVWGLAILVASASAFSPSRTISRRITLPTLKGAASESYAILRELPLPRATNGLPSPITAAWASDEDSVGEAAVVVFFRSFG